MPRFATLTAPRDDARRIAGRLRASLTAGEWAAGSRLPTERAIAERFGTSRAAVRKALAALKSEGLITQRVGAGTFAGPAHQAITEVSPAQLMDARLVFEPQIVVLAVRHATAADLARMDDCLNAAEKAKTADEFELWDANLHEAIAQATHNHFVEAVFRLLSEARRNGEWGELKRRSATPERRREYRREHRELVEALRARDAARARALLREHLVRVRGDLLGD